MTNSNILNRSNSGDDGNNAGDGTAQDDGNNVGDVAAEEDQDNFSDESNSSFLQRKAEIAKKYDASKGPYQRIKLITQDLVKSSDSDSDGGK